MIATVIGKRKVREVQGEGVDVIVDIIVNMGGERRDRLD